MEISDVQFLGSALAKVDNRKDDSAISDHDASVFVDHSTHLLGKPKTHHLHFFDDLRVKLHRSKRVKERERERRKYVNITANPNTFFKLFLHDRILINDFLLEIDDIELVSHDLVVHVRTEVI